MCSATSCCESVRVSSVKQQAHIYLNKWEFRNPSAGMKRSFSVVYCKYLEDKRWRSDRVSVFITGWIITYNDTDEEFKHTRWLFCSCEDPRWHNAFPNHYHHNPKLNPILSLTLKPSLNLLSSQVHTKITVAYYTHFIHYSSPVWVHIEMNILIPKNLTGTNRIKGWILDPSCEYNKRHPEWSGATLKVIQRGKTERDPTNVEQYFIKPMSQSPCEDICVSHRGIWLEGKN